MKRMLSISFGVFLRISSVLMGMGVLFNVKGIIKGFLVVSHLIELEDGYAYGLVLGQFAMLIVFALLAYFLWKWSTHFIYSERQKD